MLNPCSRVLRKFSGELTTIEYWAVRPPPPDLSFGRGPLFAGRSEVGAAGCSSATASVSIGRGAGGTEVLRFWQQRAEVSDLSDMSHLMTGDELAHLEQSHLTATRVADRAFPLALAPAVQEVDRTSPHAGEVLERLLERTVELLVVGGVDSGADIGRRLPIEVGVPDQAVDLRARVDEVGDQAAEGGEGGSVAVPKACVVQPVDEIADPLRDPTHEQDDIGRPRLFLWFHRTC